MVIELIQRIFNINRNNGKVIGNVVGGVASDMFVHNNGDDTKTMMTANRERGGGGGSRADRRSNDDSFLHNSTIDKCSNQCDEKLNFIYLILGTLGICVFIIDVLLLFYVNSVTDVTVLQTNLHSDYIKNEIRHIVRVALRDLHDEDRPFIISDRYVYFYVVF